MILVGLSSLSLMIRTPKEVLRIAKAAGVDAVEWAGEVHVPHGDEGAAERVMLETLRAGLTIAAFAPLYRARARGESGLRMDDVLKTADVLQAPIVRLYVGASPGAKDRDATGLDPSEIEPLAVEVRRLGDLAAKRGRTICLSLGRLARGDRHREALELVERIDHPFVRLAWETAPDPRGEESAEALEKHGLRASMLVARQLRRDGTVGPLHAEEQAWRRRLAAFKKTEPDPKMGRFVLIGAVRDDARACREGDALPCLAEDVGVLRRLIAEVEPPTKK